MISPLHLRRLFTLFSFLLFLLPAANSDLAADQTALIKFRSAVGGRTSWWNISDQSPCSWKGVNCTNNRVTELRLPGASLSGQIPVNSIGILKQLRVLSLRGNALSGPLPSDVSSWTELQSLFVQENKFSGEIPLTLFAVRNLVRLNLSNNNFSGEISPEMNKLSKLKVLKLESNHLTGSIPELKSLSHLEELDVSNNQLDGSIPSYFKKFPPNSFLGNSLCGSPLEACPSDGSKLSDGAIAGIVIGSVIGFIMILLASFFLWSRICSSQTTTRQVGISSSPAVAAATPPDLESWSPKPILVGENKSELRNGGVNSVQSDGNDDGLVFFGDGIAFFSLDELLRASAEVLGKGAFGTTYKAYLGGGTEVVVKRLKNVRVAEREFRQRLEELGALAHENLLPIKAYYYGREEKLLVFDSMFMGSLSALLHGNRGADRAPLTWEIRIKIALGTARGIEYLHSLAPNVSHGNIKSSNILLTDYYGALVSDYAINRLVSSTSTSALDSNGYCAPEVIDARKISHKADVYGFGVLVLELLTAKDPMSCGSEEADGVALPMWVQSAVQEKWTVDVFDPELLRHQSQDREQEMFQLLRLGIFCTSRHPDRRPLMMEVTKRIEEICGL